MDSISIKILAIIFSAAGFWKFVELILKFRIERGLKRAETGNVYAQANSQIVKNWMEWSEELKNKVKELEQVISDQKHRIDSLEDRVVQLEAHNRELLMELNTLKKTG